MWVDVSGHWKEQDWRPGILLEWRLVDLPRDKQRWEALVVWARGGGELPWSLNQQWMQQQYVRPMFPAEP